MSLLFSCFHYLLFSFLVVVLHVVVFFQDVVFGLCQVFFVFYIVRFSVFEHIVLYVQRGSVEQDGFYVLRVRASGLCFCFLVYVFEGHCQVNV